MVTTLLLTGHLPNIYQVVLLIVLSSIILICVVILRRLFFHPLSQVPGPFLAKLTSCYAAYHSWQGTMHLDVQRCHQVYGDLVRYGPNLILSLHGPDMAEVYGHSKPFRKSRAYKTVTPIPGGDSTLISIDKGVHRNLRRTFRTGVKADSLKKHEPKIIDNLEAYLSATTQTTDIHGWTSDVDARSWTVCLGLDTMADFGLGLKTNLLHGDAKDYLLPALHWHQKKMSLWEQLPSLDNLGLSHLVSLISLLTSRNARKFVAWHVDFAKQAIALNKDTSQGIFGPMIQSGQQQQQNQQQGTPKQPSSAPPPLPTDGHNQAQSIADSSLSTFSSADGYAVFLAGFFHYLTHHPTVYDRLAHELRSTYTPGQRIEWNATLESHTYLRAVIDEIQRLIPGASGLHLRTCEGTGVFLLQHQHQHGDPTTTTSTTADSPFPVPVGTDVGMSLYSLFRSPHVFRSPLLFDPDRWLPGTLPDLELRRARAAFKPFLVGPRNCAGAHVAVMTASVAFAHVLVNYDFRRGGRSPSKLGHLWKNNPGERGAETELEFETHFSLVWWRDGPFVQFKRRGLTD